MLHCLKQGQNILIGFLRLTPSRWWRRGIIARQIESSKPIHEVGTSTAVGSSTAGRRTPCASAVAKHPEKIVQVIAAGRSPRRRRLDPDGRAGKTLEARHASAGLLMRRGRCRAIKVDIQQVLHIVLGLWRRRLTRNCRGSGGSSQWVLSCILNLFPVIILASIPLEPDKG